MAADSGADERAVAPMMRVAPAVGVWIGASFDGTTLPRALTVALISIVTLLAAIFRVPRRDGDVSHHG